MELAAARQEGFTSKRSLETNEAQPKKKPLVVIGIFTRFGRKNNRDAIRKAWMGSGTCFNSLWAYIFSYTVLVHLDFVFVFIFV